MTQTDSPNIPTEKAKIATILAALRFWQSNALPSCNSQLSNPDNIPLYDIASCDGAFAVLSAEDIDALCEDINFGDFPGTELEGT